MRSNPAQANLISQDDAVTFGLAGNFDVVHFFKQAQVCATFFLALFLLVFMPLLPSTAFALAANTPPVANAGPGQTVTSGAIVTLDGSGSSDADAGTVLTYEWQQNSGSAVVLDRFNVKPTFTAPILAEGDNTQYLEFVLIVSDGKDRKTDFVTITVLAPVAKQDQTISFTSVAPSNAIIGGTYTPVASATSGLNVIVTIAPASAAICSMESKLVTFVAEGHCTIAANQAGNTTVSAAAEVTQTLHIGAAPVSTADSDAVGEVQENATATVAEISSEMITDTVGDAIGDAFNESPQVVLLEDNGARVNFDAEPKSPAAKAIDELDLASRAAMRKRSGGSVPGLFAYDDAAVISADAVDPKRWSVWGSARISQLSTSAALAELGGNQYNFTGGVGYRLSTEMIVGIIGGGETFTYANNLGAELSGTGLTGGAYIGWRPANGLRFDGQLSATALNYDSLSGVVTGAFSASRIQASVGIAGSFSAASMQFEPTLRATGTWEQQQAYTDSAGMAHAARSFEFGKISAGLKASKTFAIDGDTSITPYASMFADYRFSSGDTSATSKAFDDFSGRIGLGFNANLNAATTFGLDADVSGLGLEDALLWSLKMKLGLAF